MDLKDRLSLGWEIVKLDRAASAQAASDEDAFGPAVLFFAIGGLAGGLGGAFFSGGATLILAPVGAVVWSFLSVFILHAFARLMGGTGNFRGYYSALGLGSLPHWAGFIPLLGHVVGLWYIPVAVVATESVHNLSTARALVVVLLPLVILIVLFIAIVALVGMAAIMALIHQGGAQGF